MTFVWFIIWLIANNVGGSEPLAVVSREIEAWINHAFPAQGAYQPFRFFAVVRGEQGFHLGVAYDHVLAGAGVTPRSPRKASADGFALKIGQRATLVRARDSIAWGMVYAMSPEELAKLYGGPGLEAYQPQEIEVALENRAIIPARVYTLAHPPAQDEPNPEYAEKLKAVLTRLGFPAEYVAGIQ